MGTSLLSISLEHYLEEGDMVAAEKVILKGIKFWENRLVAKPGDPHVLNELSNIYYTYAQFLESTDRDAEAMKYMEKAEENNPDFFQNMIKSLFETPIVSNE